MLSDHDYFFKNLICESDFMHLIDWCIVFGVLASLTVVAVYTKRFTRSVADFLAGGRCAKRYVLTISEGTAGLGAISLVAFFEMYYKGGFSMTWWVLFYNVMAAFVAMSGWMIYRYRQTRVLTLGQMLEMRYSRRFRIFAGFVAWTSGLINFGIFPAVGSRFFIHYCGLQSHIVSVGIFEINLTYTALLFILISIALFFTFASGQVAVIVTDFLQGFFMNITILVLLGTLFFYMDWTHVVEALSQAPEKESMLNPLDTSRAEDFNVWFVLIMIFMAFYQTGAWLGSSGYMASARTPHEARMGRIIGIWRLIPLYLMFVLVPVCSYTLLNHPAYSVDAAQVNGAIAEIDMGNETATEAIRNQMTVPLALRQMLPIGLLGTFCAMMLAAFISTHNTYMHSWGSIFIQDVVMPFRNKPLSPRQHIVWLRCSIVSVALFIFAFGMIFRQTEYILMFQAITGAIWLGGAGSIILGGLYWKRGTTTAAYAALITGSVIATAKVIMHQVHASHPDFFSTIPVIGKALFLFVETNSMVISFFAGLCAILIYVIISLSGKRIVFNMDRMLHRGRYAIADDAAGDASEIISPWRKAIVMGSDFSRGDKIFYLGTLGWQVLWFFVFIIGTLYAYWKSLDAESWARFWQVYVTVMSSISAVAIIWISIGGLFNMRSLFHLLATRKQDDTDDGRVIDNPDEDAIIGN